MRALTTCLIAGLALLLAGCPGSHGGSGSGSGNGNGGNSAGLTILSGSENKTLEPIIDRFAQKKGASIKMDFTGSVDIMLQLESGSVAADAVWPANSLWVSLGDTKKQVKYASSVMSSPVVLGVKKSVAQRLGWVGKTVHVADILSAAEGGKLRFMMTSATQSNSGASAYMGYLYAFAGRPEVLTKDHLAKPEVRDKIKRILGAVERSSGSSGWLKDLFLKKYDAYDAMVNYEAVVIEANQQLTSEGKEPLYAVYPVDGLAMADSPLGYVDHGDSAKEALFKELQAYLLSPEVQNEILGQGRRVGLGGLGMAKGDPTVFNPQWGIDTQKVLNPIKFPQPEVIRQALDLYQTAFRKPSFTVYCVDFSGSMKGQPAEDVKSAMRLLLDQQQARRYLLQASPEDVTVVIPFNHEPIARWEARGPGLSSLLQKVYTLQADGGTDIYTPVMQAFDAMRSEQKLENYFPAVILMTDGQSNRGANFAQLQQHIRAANLAQDVPVYSILFGEASKDQLDQIASFTSGRIFDGRKDLIQAFREARGYN